MSTPLPSTHPRHPARSIVGWLAGALLLASFASVTGCRSAIPDVATSRLDYERTTADGSRIKIALSSPREVEIGGATIDPSSGVLTLTNYSAVPNQGALRARVDEVAGYREMFREGKELGKELGALAVLGWTGREARPSPGTPSAAPPRLAPEDIDQIVALLRASLSSTNSVSTNLTLRSAQ